jgi:hypothetical protein
MNPKKKSRRYRVSVSIHALDLAISRFTHSLDYLLLELLIFVQIFEFYLVTQSL